MKHHDPSTDYGRYPTLAPLPEELLGRFARCEHCGCADFRFLLPDWTTVCKKCGSMIEHPTMPVAPAKQHLPLPQISGDYILLPNGGVQYLHGHDVNHDDVHGWFGITAIAAGTCIAGLRSDGTVAISPRPEPLHSFYRFGTQNWRDITAIAAKADVVGLFADGTVRAVGPNYYGECNVQNWSGITAIAVSSEHTVGLCADGTVRAVGKNDNGKCDVSQWSSITAIDASDDHTVGLCSDGTVRAVGGFPHYEYGECHVQSWTDICAITASNHCTVGLRKDGTVLAIGDNRFGQCDVQSWTNVVRIATTGKDTIGFRDDGTILCTNPKLLEKIHRALA